MWSVKALIAFGADINHSNSRRQTPLDVLMSGGCRDREIMEEMFSKLHAIPGGWESPKKPRLLDESINSIVNESYEIEEDQKLGKSRCGLIDEN